MYYLRLFFFDGVPYAGYSYRHITLTNLQKQIECVSLYGEIMQSLCHFSKIHVKKKQKAYLSAV